MRSQPWEGAISIEKPKDVLNINELAGYLDIAKSTICKLVREGKIPAQKVGRHRRFYKKTIDAWLGHYNSADIMFETPDKNRSSR